MKIFKKVIAGVAALAIAVSGISFGTASLKEAKAAEVSSLQEVPEHVGETVLASFVTNDEGAFEPAAKGNTNMKCYAQGLSEWMNDPDVYLKLTASNVKYTDSKSGTSYNFEDVVGWGACEWTSFAHYYNNWNDSDKQFDIQLRPTTNSTAAEAYSYIKLSELKLDAYNGINGNFDTAYHSFDDGIKIESLEIVKLDMDTTVYAYQEVAVPTPKTTEFGQDLILDGYFDFSKASENAEITIEFTVDNTGWPGFSVLDSGWKYQNNKLDFGGYDNSAKSVTIKISQLVAMGMTSNDKLLITAYNNGGKDIAFSKITIKNAEANGEIFKPVVHVTGVSLDETDLSFSLEAAGANPATAELTATISPSDADDKSVEWSSADEAVATVEDGVVTPVGEGSTTITVTAEGGKMASCTVTVSAVLPEGLAITGADSTTVKGGDVVSLGVTVSPDNALDKTVKWSSGDTAVATVDANGKVTFANVTDTKTVTITATSNADAAVKDSVTFTVEKLVIDNPVTGVTISKDTLELSKGQTGNLSATVLPDNASLKTVTWSSSDESVAEVDADGVVTAVGMGTATITVKTVDGEKTASCEVTVTEPKATDVTVFSNGAEIEEDKLSVMEGRIRNLTAQALPEDAAQKFTFASSDESIVTVDENGKLTAVAKGTAVITVSADGASKEIEVTVTEKSNVPYTTDEGTVIFDGKETTEGKWNPVAACRHYFKEDGSIDFSIITSGSVVKAYYTCDKAPQLILQKYNDAKLNWIKVDPYLTEDGIAYFSYEDMVEAFGDLSVADALYIADNGAVLTVTKVVVADNAEDDGSITVEAEGEFAPSIEMSKKEVVAAISKVLTEEQLAAVEAGTAVVDIKLAVANIDDTVTEADKELIAEAIKNIPDSEKLNFKVLDYLDITLGAEIDGDRIAVTETDGLMTVSVAVEKPVKGTYKVVRIHDGKTDVIDSTLSEDGTRLTFKTDKFSTYAIIFSDVATGDSANAALIILLGIACAALIAAVAARKTAKQ